MSVTGQYKILVKEGESDGKLYPIADRSAAVFREFRELQVSSTYYSEEERYAFVTEMRWDEKWIESRNEEKETVRLKEATLGYDAFLVAASKLLFPSAPIDENADYIDFEVANSAIEDFTKRTGRKKSRLIGF